MWTKFSNFLAKIFTMLSAGDSKETFNHLEARRSINLENLEALKKLRIKNF